MIYLTNQRYATVSKRWRNVFYRIYVVWCAKSVGPSYTKETEERGV